MIQEINLDWWRQLSPQWKQAFAETCFMHTGEPAPGELLQLAQAPALRFAGPTAPYPNMSFELTDLSGLTALTNLEILVVIHQQLESVRELRALIRLKSLFLYYNRINSLEGIEELTQLEQLYVQGNQIDTIKPVEKLTRLKEFYINDNRVESLEGLTEDHADQLDKFFCRPNDGLPRKEWLRVERELGIQCRSL